MTSDIDTQTAQSIDQDTGIQGERIKVTNNHRLNKKALIAEIEEALGFSLNAMTPGLS